MLNSNYLDGIYCVGFLESDIAMIFFDLIGCLTEENFEMLNRLMKVKFRL